jgi:hypothetical protein
MKSSETGTTFGCAWGVACTPCHGAAAKNRRAGQLSPPVTGTADSGGYPGNITDL